MTTLKDLSDRVEAIENRNKMVESNERISFAREARK